MHDHTSISNLVQFMLRTDELYVNKFEMRCFIGLHLTHTISNLDSSVKLYLINLIAVDIIDNYSD